MYESPIKDLTPEEISKVAASVPAIPKPSNGNCIHIPNRPVHRTIKVRGSLRVMDLCKGCYGVMERAGCIAEVVS